MDPQHFAHAPISSVAAGACHSAAVTAGGALYTWGQGEAWYIGSQVPSGLGHADLANRLVPTLVQRQLGRSTWIAGEAFTAADISITYALEFGRRQGVFTLDEVETAYLARTMSREAYGRALDASMAGVQT